MGRVASIVAPHGRVVKHMIPLERAVKALIQQERCGKVPALAPASSQCCGTAQAGCQGRLPA